MGRPPCFDDIGLKKGPWTPEEDEKLVACIQKNGHHRSWKSFPKLAGLNRCGKSCRLRWNNYLRPDIKRGKFTEEEQHLIISLHSLHGNKWAKIASHLAGRTDNEIKNYWNTSLKKKLQSMGIDPVTHRPRVDLKLLATLPHLLNTAAANFSNSTNHWENNDALVRAQADHAAAQLLNMKLFCYLLQTFNMMPSNQMLGTYNPGGLAPFQDQLLGSTMQLNDCHLNGHLVDHHHQNIFSPPGSDFLNVGVMQPSDAYQSSADSLNNYQAPIENQYLNDSNNAGTGNSVSASPECSSVRETELDMEVKSYNIPRSESWEELLGDEFTDFSWMDLLKQTCEL